MMKIKARIGGWTLVATLIAGLTACEGGVGVNVVQVGTQVQVSITPRTWSDKPCVKTFDVYREPATDSTEIWESTLVRDDRCVNHFTLGVVPDGFETSMKFIPPIRGEKYLVSVRGIGFSGQADFVVGDHDGRIGHG